jgi:hypothetical protein
MDTPFAKYQSRTTDSNADECCGFRATTFEHTRHNNAGSNHTIDDTRAATRYDARFRSARDTRYRNATDK